MVREPWRYTCPLCHNSGRLRRRTSVEKIDYHSGGKPYYCGHCNIKLDGKYDERDDQLIRPDGSLVEPNHKD